MNLVFITEARFVLLEDGSFCSLESSFNQKLFERYLQHFEQVTILARTKNAGHDDILPENRFSVKSVSLIPLPYYIGLNQFIKQYFKLRKILQKSLPANPDLNTTFICRIPGRIGATAITILKKRNIPYGIEVVGDPYDVLSKNATNHPLRPIIRLLSYYSLKRIVRIAPAALYVTKRKLQERYPCKNYCIGISDVVIPSGSIIDEPGDFPSSGLVRLISVGSLDQMQKAPDITLQAIKLLNEGGYTVSFTWIGGGKYLQKMILLAETLGIGNLISFTGKLPVGAPVINELDSSNIFVMASRMEGLPRAMVEAMARGLPCIGTNVGGIPELLDESALVPVNNAVALAKKIAYFIDNPEFAKAQSRRNLMVAKEFEETKLNNERKKFFDYLKNITARPIKI